MSEGFFCLKCVRALQDLSDEEIFKISDGVRDAEYDAGQLIYIPEEAQGKIFFLREGEVDIYHKAGTGKKIVVNTLQAGDMFGDLHLVEGSADKQGDYARAVSRVRVCMVDKVAFMDYLQDNPKVAFKIIEELSKRLTRAESQVRDLALNNVSIRLVNELKRLADQYGEVVGEEIRITKHLTHEELADRISSTRETVTKAMKNLEEQRQVRYDADRHIVIRKTHSIIS